MMAWCLFIAMLFTAPADQPVSVSAAADSMLVTPSKGESILSDHMPGGKRTVPGKARVAIVIDDFGQYNSEGVSEMLSLGIPITCAVMPNLENTVKHAEEAAGKGHQIIVHLPLEPVRGKKKWLGPGSITTGMPDREIKKMVSMDFESVPHAVGFNNHMGSAVTADERAMRLILQVAQEKNFFVLDSRTTEKTLIPSLCQELGITCISRDIFLDDLKSPDFTRKQLLKLGREALKKGRAVGIGHVGRGGRITARALEEMIPGMEEMGIEFVHLSEIAYEFTAGHRENIEKEDYVFFSFPYGRGM